MSTASAEIFPGLETNFELSKVREYVLWEIRVDQGVVNEGYADESEMGEIGEPNLKEVTKEVDAESEVCSFKLLCRYKHNVSLVDNL